MKEEKKPENILLDKQQNLQKILLYGAAVFLVFIVGVIGYALFSAKNSVSNVNSTNNIIPPEKKESNFINLQVEDNNKITQEEGKENRVQLEKNEIQQRDDIPPVAVEEESIPSAKEMPPVSEIPKKEPVVEKEKPVVVKKESHKVNSHVVKGKYYVQVAALLRKSPDKRFLDLVKKEGYSYTIITTYKNINGERVKVTKVLIGPFNTKSKAREELFSVRDKITKAAFIYKAN